MKKYILILGLVTSFSSFADSVCVSSPGKLNCGAGSIATLPGDAYGTVSLNGTKVTDSTTTTAGKFSANSASLNNVMITAGTVNIAASQLTGDKIQIMSGAMNLNKSKIQSKAVLYSPNVNLLQSITQSLEINSSQATQNLIVNLGAGSVVNGDITFNNGHGELCLDGGKFTGKLSGGVVHQGSCSI